MSRHLIAIAGNPNVGKTTLFNALTDSRARVGNYPGVTVDRRSASLHFANGEEAELVDIPGTYSLTARAADEQIALEALLGLRGQTKPDAVVFCVDSTQLVRSSYLVVQAQELGIPTVIALTMYDEAGDAAPKPEAIAELFECPVIAVVASSKQGLRELKEAIHEIAHSDSSDSRWRWKPSSELAAQLELVQAELPEQWPSSRGMALWALMSVGDDELIGIPASLRKAITALSADGAAIDDLVIESRYRWLDGRLAQLTTSRPPRRMTDKVDRLLLHRVGGFAVFLAIMFVVFQSLFAWADPAIGLIEGLFGWVGDWIGGVLPEGIFNEFVVGGIIAGVGSVVVFLPQILLLFFFIGLMEDSGYMARVAYLMDRIMQSMNLHGRAFVPMMSGFACAVPAILATRSMERQRDRLLTMMVVPLMTCSARLPVYTLLIAAMFPPSSILGVFPVQGTLMVAMYLFSTTTALAAAWVMSKTVKPLKAKRLPFVIELPPYRMPNLSDVVRMMWERTSFFLREAGTVILVCTIVLWALLSFPRHLDDPSKDYDGLLATATTAQVESLTAERQGERLRESYAGRIGRAVEPVIEPLGFDWKIGVGLIGAFAAREVFISTMGVVYSIGEEVDESSEPLRNKLKAEKRSDGSPLYTPLVALSLMVFFALACQCMSTLAVVRRETKSWRWPLFLLAYMSTLAWIASFAVFQVGKALGF